MVFIYMFVYLFVFLGNRAMRINYGGRVVFVWGTQVLGSLYRIKHEDTLFKFSYLENGVQGSSPMLKF